VRFEESKGLSHGEVGERKSDVPHGMRGEAMIVGTCFCHLRVTLRAGACDNDR
jgi:hypothetical protein